MTATTVDDVRDTIAVAVTAAEGISTRQGCLDLAGIVRGVEKTVEKRAKTRTPAVRALGAAAVHLSRAGGPITVQLATRLASAALTEALAAMGGE